MFQGWGFVWHTVRCVRSIGLGEAELQAGERGKNKKEDGSIVLCKNSTKDNRTDMLA